MVQVRSSGTMVHHSFGNSPSTHNQVVDNVVDCMHTHTHAHTQMRTHTYRCINKQILVLWWVGHDGALVSLPLLGWEAATVDHQQELF